MKKLMLVIMAIVALLSGCATIENYENVLRSWMGKDVNLLIQTYGYPSSTMELANGNTVYIYMRSHQYTSPTYQDTNSNYNYYSNGKYGGYVQG